MPRLPDARMKPGPVPGFFLFWAIVGCGEPAETPAAESPAIGLGARLSIPGTIEHGGIREASGLASSRRRPGVLWLHNDRGDKARIYAMDDSGRTLGRIRLKKADNEDWEDIAAFALDGQPYLLVADIGDNDAVRDDTMLYVIAEPDLDADDRPELTASWTVPFSYEDGARDAEAVAVDIENQRVLVLSKRDLPPRLYEVSLIPGGDRPAIARFLGEVGSLPRPSTRDVGFAPKTGNWYWQPTAMDIAPDGSAIAVLTYGAVYF